MGITTPVEWDFLGVEPGFRVNQATNPTNPASFWSLRVPTNYSASNSIMFRRLKQFTSATPLQQSIEAWVSPNIDGVSVYSAAIAVRSHGSLSPSLFIHYEFVILFDTETSGGRVQLVLTRQNAGTAVTLAASTPVVGSSPLSTDTWGIRLRAKDVGSNDCHIVAQFNRNDTGWTGESTFNIKDLNSPIFSTSGSYLWATVTPPSPPNSPSADQYIDWDDVVCDALDTEDIALLSAATDFAG